MRTAVGATVLFRVASERGEKPGERGGLVGYQVKLDSMRSERVRSDFSSSEIMERDIMR